MTVQVVGYRVHPSACVCNGRGKVRVSLLAGDGDESAQWLARWWSRWITCPHCRNSADLVRFLADHDVFDGGDAA